MEPNDTARTAETGGPGHDRRLADRFARHLAESTLLPEDAHALVAVSGGLDSVALLHLLRFTRPVAGLRLSAAHFDHGMRSGSGADAEWMSGLCRAWGLPLESGRASRPPRNEAEARWERYAFLEAAASRIGADRIATAHHADDQAETVLFRALRGAGPSGLRGIAPRRGRIVRPLLPFRRRELEAYAAAVRLGYRQDPTNLLPRYTRNRLRSEVLPRLELIVPGAGAALARLAERARELDDALGWIADRLEADALLTADDAGFELARQVFLSYHPHLRARVLRRLLRRLGSHPDSAGTRAALQFINRVSSGRVFHAPGGVRIEREFDRIRITRSGSPAPPERPVIIDGAAGGSGIAVIGGTAYGVEWGQEPAGGAGECEVFDASALRFPLTVRGWRPGDRLRLPFGTKKLKKLFGEHRIGRGRRARVPVLADRDGTVLWVPKLARAALHEPGAGPVFHVRVTERSIRGSQC